MPNCGDGKNALGLLRLAWFRRLYTSARIVKLNDSGDPRGRKTRASEASALINPGPVKALRPLEPTAPGRGGANAAGLRRTRPPGLGVDTRASSGFKRFARSLNNTGNPLPEAV